MRQSGPGVRRPRGRHNSGGSNGGSQSGPPPGPSSMRGGDNRVRSASSLRHQTFDSNGPDVRVRGNAWQVYEKYQSLARDATSAGDRVMAENYLQHAEHYYRIIEAIEEATAAEQRQRGGPAVPQQGFGGGQPDVPANYFTPDGQLAAATQGNQPAQQGMQQPQQPVQQPMSGAPVQPSGEPMAQAEVQRRSPPPSPFFAQEETEDTDSGPQTLVAQR